jgi:hypothetical protein
MVLQDRMDTEALVSGSLRSSLSLFPTQCGTCLPPPSPLSPHTLVLRRVALEWDAGAIYQHDHLWRSLVCFKCFPSEVPNSRVTTWNPYPRAVLVLVMKTYWRWGLRKGTKGKMISTIVRIHPRHLGGLTRAAMRSISTCHLRSPHLPPFEFV